MDNLLTPEEKHELHVKWLGDEKTTKQWPDYQSEAQDKKTAAFWEVFWQADISTGEALHKAELTKLREQHNGEIKGIAKRIFWELEDTNCPHPPHWPTPKRHCIHCFSELKAKWTGEK
jgi:hypothetical protein